MTSSTENMPIGELNAGIALKQKKILIGGVVGVLALAFIGRFAFNLWSYEETDDARTAANSAVLASKVGGVVNEILVHENQTVKAGDILVKIDPRDFQNRIDQVEADLGSLQATLRNAEKDHQRMKTLLSTDSVSVQQADTAQSKYLELSRKEASLRAQLNQAKLDLEYSEVKAPTGGRVGRRAIEKGTVVAPGQPLVAFVQSTEHWVVANFKETQLQHMKIGQPVEVSIDAISNHVFHGTVDSFSPGSGSAFSIIPADNATGNYVKVVQRVPVRIALDEKAIEGYEDRFVPGLSVIASVRVR